jgi:hypothetical protein
MIVAGSIGKSGVEHFTLGSTSEKVVRHAKSFICVKPPEKQEIKNVILKWDNKIMGEWD